MSSFTELLQDKAQAKRIGLYAFKENPKIKNFEEFEHALKKAFSGDTRGQGILNFLNDEESKMIFENSAIQRLIRENGGETEDESYEIQRKLDIGEKTKMTDIQVVQISKPYKSISANGTEYTKGYSRWTNAEIKFVAVRKARGDKPKQIIDAYNRHFVQKEQQRSGSSIRTKIYRV